MSIKSNYSKQEISFSINTNDLCDDTVYINEKVASACNKLIEASNRSSSFKEDALNDASLAEEEDSTISETSSLALISSLNNNNKPQNDQSIVKIIFFV